MLRTFNYTGRNCIERTEVRIRKEDTEDNVPEIDADFNFKERGLPGKSKIYIEAGYKNTLQRFDFGTLDSILRPKERALDRIDLSGPTQFRVRIVDESDEVGRILASADRLRAEGEEDHDQKTSLLRLCSRPLGQQVWKLEIEANQKPELVINSNIPGAIGKLRTDVLFKALILPAALREVLLFYVNSLPDEEDAIFEQWMLFAESISMKRPADEDLQIDWVDSVVEEFSRKFSFCDALVNVLEVNS